MVKGRLQELGEFNTKLSSQFEILCDEAGFSNQKIAGLCRVSIKNVRAWKDVNNALTPDWVHLLALCHASKMNFAARYTRVMDNNN